MNIPEYSLELLLAYDGRKEVLESGHFLKFRIERVEKSSRVPHGLSYSFTFHDPSGQRLLGFDNAHPVPALGNNFVDQPTESDHWHRTSNDKGRPYSFVSVEQLLTDFFNAVDAKLGELGLPYNVESSN